MNQTRQNGLKRLPLLSWLAGRSRRHLIIDASWHYMHLFHTKAYRPQFEYRRLFQVHRSKIGFYTSILERAENRFFSRTGGIYWIIVYVTVTDGLTTFIPLYLENSAAEIGKSCATLPTLSELLWKQPISNIDVLADKLEHESNSKSLIFVTCRLWGYKRRRWSFISPLFRQGTNKSLRITSKILGLKTHLMPELLDFPVNAIS